MEILFAAGILSRTYNCSKVDAARVSAEIALWEEKNVSSAVGCLTRDVL
jgi:hypothetical protein